MCKLSESFLYLQEKETTEILNMTNLISLETRKENKLILSFQEDDNLALKIKLKSDQVRSISECYNMLLKLKEKNSISKKQREETRLEVILAVEKHVKKRTFMTKQSSTKISPISPFNTHKLMSIQEENIKKEQEKEGEEQEKEEDLISTKNSSFQKNLMDMKKTSDLNYIETLKDINSKNISHKFTNISIGNIPQRRALPKLQEKRKKMRSLDTKFLSYSDIINKSGDLRGGDWREQTKLSEMKKTAIIPEKILEEEEGDDDESKDDKIEEGEFEEKQNLRKSSNTIKNMFLKVNHRKEDEKESGGDEMIGFYKKLSRNSSLVVDDYDVDFPLEITDENLIKKIEDGPVFENFANFFNNYQTHSEKPKELKPKENIQFLVNNENLKFKISAPLISYKNSSVNQFNSGVSKIEGEAETNNQIQDKKDEKLKIDNIPPLSLPTKNLTDEPIKLNNNDHLITPNTPKKLSDFFRKESHEKISKNHFSLSENLQEKFKFSWNETFQIAIETINRSNSKDEILRCKEAMSYVENEFIDFSKSVGEIIINELYLPLENKTIKPTEIGGVIG